jgi:ABC-type amino acid transport substrate-binding protein
MQDGTPTGFDLELMRAICTQLKLRMRPVRYPGSDFNGIFAGLEQGIYDAVISGTTTTPQRAQRVPFSKPYLTFNQGVSSLTTNRPQLAVALQVPTNEELDIAFAKSNQPLCDAVNETLGALKRDGTFAALTARWFPNQTTRSSS